jgi:hypothetical protein
MLWAKTPLIQSHVRSSHGVLRLHHPDDIGDAGLVPLPRQLNMFLRQVTAFSSRPQK